MDPVYGLPMNPCWYDISAGSFTGLHHQSTLPINPYAVPCPVGLQSLTHSHLSVPLTSTTTSPHQVCQKTQVPMSLCTGTVPVTSYDVPMTPHVNFPVGTNQLPTSCTGSVPVTLGQSLTAPIPLQPGVSGSSGELEALVRLTEIVGQLQQQVTQLAETSSRQKLMQSRQQAVGYYISEVFRQ
jgi:hypothetical protein